jgi:hypothetical protein
MVAVKFSPLTINKNNKSDRKRIANISLAKAPISIKLRNLELIQKNYIRKKLKINNLN